MYDFAINQCQIFKIIGDKISTVRKILMLLPQTLAIEINQFSQHLSYTIIIAYTHPFPKTYLWYQI